MQTSTKTSADNVTFIKEAFESPQWYLQRTAYNITLRAEIIQEFLKGTDSRAILDIGCGDGSLSVNLLNANNHVTFLDQSQTMLGIVRSRIPKQFSTQINTINAGFMEAELPPASFDLIICVGVLAYIEIPDRPNFIGRIKKLLKPDGLLILECTDGANIVSHINRTYASMLRILKPSKMKTIVGNSADVLSVCRDLGFVLKGSYRYSLPLPLMVKLMSSKGKYNMIRSLYRTAGTNRLQWLGNECMYYFKMPGK